LPVVSVLSVRLPADGVESFQRYEEQVLPLLANQSGRLERRLRSPDGRIEVHLVSFSSVEHFHSYRDDPRHAELQPLLERSGAQADLYELYDVL
jgi:hypothetical protein